MNERIRAVRKHFSLTLEKFGERIGIKKAALSQLENGVSNPSNQTIIMICREFGVSEIWLRTGEGEMFSETTERERIAEIFSGILSERNEDGFREVRIALAELVADLPEDALKLVVDFAKKLAEKYE